MNENRRIFFRILDMICILTALGLSSWLVIPPFLNVFSDYSGASTFTVFFFFLSFYMLDCYAVGSEDFRDSVVRVIMAVVIGIIATGFIFYTAEHWRFPRMTFVLQMAITLVLTLGWRYLYFRFSAHFSPKPDRVIFLGAVAAGRARKILLEHGHNDIILGYVGTSGDHDEEAGELLGSVESILDIVKQLNATRVVILESHLLNKELSHSLFEAKVHGLLIDDMRSIYESMAKRLPIDLIQDKWLLLENGFNLNARNSLWRFKRAFDVFFALGLLILAIPVMLLAMLLVRIESKGSAIYSQRRVGKGMEEFTVYKIRSMRNDAEKDGAVWASQEDPRVTNIGKFIRKTRIDELPQLINVLKGEMSVVGPRPERMDFVEDLAENLPYYNIRHAVKPGITGWAQVSYPYGASLEDARYKLEYDLYYVKNMSLLLEAKIILRTIGVVLFPKGAR